MQNVGYGLSQTSLNTSTSSVYQGYETVQSPEEYMAAPPMLMSGVEQQAALEGPLSSAVDACQNYHVLSAGDLQQTIRHCQILDSKIAEKTGQLEVEHKMVEAASSLSRLHLESHKKEHRMSRVFSSGEKAKRLSRQAEDEMEVSMSRVHALETSLLGLRFERAELEIKVLQHRAALMAQSVLHSQQIPSLDHDTMPTPRALGHSRVDSGQTLRGPLSDDSVDPRDELAMLAAKIKTALPGTTFKEASDLALVGAGVGLLVKDRARLSRLVEETQSEVGVHKSRAEHFAEKLQNKDNSLLNEDPTEKARLNASLLEVRRDLDNERQTSTMLRDRSETQRQELEKTVGSLEEVTRLAVGYENERTAFGDMMHRLEDRVKQLESQDIDATSGERLESSASVGILCREFRSILHEQQQKNWTEQRLLREALIGLRPLNSVPPAKAPVPAAPDAQLAPQQPKTAPARSAQLAQPMVPNRTSTPPVPTVFGTPLNSSPMPPTQQTSPNRYKKRAERPQSPRKSYERYEAQAEPQMSPNHAPTQVQARTPMGSNRMSRYTGYHVNGQQTSDDYDLL